jgi:predicted regulator of Ras-like GTPase activity (Roadblock/LC7/MglB family)
MTKKKKETDLTNEVTESITHIHLTTSESDLRAKLEEIRGREGVIGYILRNSHSASIDLKDPAKIIDYAILSSSTIDASEELSDLFNVGDIKTIIVEGKNAKMLSVIIDENRVTIFMEKNFDAETLKNVFCP